MSRKPEDMTLDELLDQSEIKDWLFRAEREMFPNMKDSATVAIIYPEHPDAKVCLELGAAIYYDKPLIVLVPPGRKINKGLKRIAHCVIENFEASNEECEAKFMSALKKYTRGR